MAVRSKPYALADMQIRKQRAVSKKQITDKSIEQIETRQIQQIAWVLKSYVDVIELLCGKTGDSKDNLVSAALNANHHMVDSQVEPDVVKDLKSLKERIISRDISLPNIKSFLTTSAEDLPLNQSILLELMFSFLDISNKAEDLGRSTGSITKEEAQVKQQKVINTQNRQGTVAEHTELLRAAASEYIDGLVAAVGITAVINKYDTDLARGLRKSYQTACEWDDRVYIKAIKYALKQKGIVKPAKTKINTKST